jgi:TPR repeat protein
MKLTLKHAIAAIVLVFGFAAPVTAGQFEDAAAAYNRGDYATALQLFRSLADRGDAKAQMSLGAMYNLGRGVPQEFTEGVKWSRRAAEQGNAGAQASLGGAYYEGHGVTRDYVEAAKWYRLESRPDGIFGRDRGRSYFG